MKGGGGQRGDDGSNKSKQKSQGGETSLAEQLRGNKGVKGVENRKEKKEGMKDSPLMLFQAYRKIWRKQKKVRRRGSWRQHADRKVGRKRKKGNLKISTEQIHFPTRGGKTKDEKGEKKGMTKSTTWKRNKGSPGIRPSFLGPGIEKRGKVENLQKKGKSSTSQVTS